MWLILIQFQSSYRHANLTETLLVRSLLYFLKGPPVRTIGVLSWNLISSKHWWELQESRSQYFCYISYQQGELRPLDKVFMLHLIVLEWERENSYKGEVTAYITHFRLHNRLILPFGDSSSTAAWRERSSQLMNIGLLLFSYCRATESSRRLRERIWLSLCLPRLQRSGVEIFLRFIYLLWAWHDKESDCQSRKASLNFKFLF